MFPLETHLPECERGRAKGRPAAAIASIEAWVKAYVHIKYCKIVQRWVVVNSADTHFGSYEDN